MRRCSPGSAIAPRWIASSRTHGGVGGLRISNPRRRNQRQLNEVRGPLRYSRLSGHGGRGGGSRTERSVRGLAGRRLPVRRTAADDPSEQRSPAGPAGRRHHQRSEDDAVFKVVINHEEQHSIWPADREAPAGWTEVGVAGSKDECLEYVRGAWPDITPLSVRRALAES
ncbi:MbtH family protein [Streptomyces sp. NPDC002073]